MQVKKQQLEPDMELQTGSNLGKEYVKAVYCHTAYLTYMQNEEVTVAQSYSTRCESMNGSLSGSSVNGILQPESWSVLPFLLQYAEYIM